MDTVQEKDVKGQIEGQEVKEKTEIEDTVSFADVGNRRDLEQVFAEHPKLLTEFDWDGDPEAANKFKEKYGKAKAESTDAADVKKGSLDETEEDFLADDEPGAPAEKKADNQPSNALDSNLEAKLTETNVRLQEAMQEIEKLKKGSTPQEKKAIDAEIKDLDLSGLIDLGDDVDLFSEDGQSKALNHIKALTKAVKDVNHLASSYKKRLDEIDQVKVDVGSIKTESDTKAKVASNEEYLTNEFKTMDEMVKTRKEIFGDKVRPIKAIEDDYILAVTEMLGKVARSHAPVFDESGKWSAEACRALELYRGKTEKAKRFQAKCKEAAVGLPEDIAILETIYEIRQIRDELSAKDDAGNIIKAADYGKAAENYLGRNLSKFRVKDRIESRSSNEIAVANRKNFAPETRPGAAPEDEDINKIDPTELERILKTMPNKLSKREREIRYKALIAVGTPKEEAYYSSGMDEAKEE